MKETSPHVVVTAVRCISSQLQEGKPPLKHTLMFFVFAASLSFLPLNAHGQEQRDIVPVSAVAFGELRGDTTVSIEKGAEKIPGLKSGRTAFWWSFLGTTVPALVGIGAPVMLVPAVLVGPSLGHFYAGRSGTAWAGMGIRTLAGVVVLVGAALGSDENSSDHSTSSNTLIAVGAILGSASVVWDIARAPHSAHVHNDEIRRKHATVGIAPSFGAAGPGLCAEIRF
jgi:hypothetical protein